MVAITAAEQMRCCILAPRFQNEEFYSERTVMFFTFLKSLFTSSFLFPRTKQLSSTQSLSLKAANSTSSMCSSSSTAQHIMRILDDLYPDPPAPLDHYDTFTFLIAVILSAQTTDGSVNLATKELFRLAPDPQTLSKMDPKEVQGLIARVGLAPKKSVYIVETAKAIVDKFGGVVPSTLDELQTLPGVGLKTASVVLSHSFGIESFGVDTHIHRLAKRWNISAEGKSAEVAQKDLMNYFPQEKWNKLHLQMIYFGREYCTAVNHDNKNCPMCSWVKSKTKDPPTEYHIYTPMKEKKGIVFYSERVKEINSRSLEQKEIMGLKSSPISSTTPDASELVNTMDKTVEKITGKKRKSTKTKQTYTDRTALPQ